MLSAAETTLRSRSSEAYRSAINRRAMPSNQAPSEPSVGIEPVPALPGPDEHLLDEFLGVVMVAEPEHSDPLHHPGVAVESLPKREVIAGLEPLRPLAVQCRLCRPTHRVPPGGWEKWTGHKQSVGHHTMGTAVMAMLSSYPRVELLKDPPQVINTSRGLPPRSNSRSSGTSPLDHSSRDSTVNRRVDPF